MPLMKATQISKPGGDLELVQKEIPLSKENEVRLKVQACGICHGDANLLHIRLHRKLSNSSFNGEK